MSNLTMSTPAIDVATKRSDHIAVTWKDTIIVWGGLDRDAVDNPVHYFSPSRVFYHKEGEWLMKETTGDLPRDQPHQNATAHVLGDEMFVYGSGRNDGLRAACHNLCYIITPHLVLHCHATPCVTLSLTFVTSCVTLSHTFVTIRIHLLL